MTDAPAPRPWCRHWVERCGTPHESAADATSRAIRAAEAPFEAARHALLARYGEPGVTEALDELDAHLDEIVEREPWLVALEAKARETIARADAVVADIDRFLAAAAAAEATPGDPES